MYRLTVVQFVPNANYAEELKAFNEARRYQSGFDGLQHGGPSRETEVRKLDVEVTDAEFAAIKKAVVEIL